jgi:hypothetical protein
MHETEEAIPDTLRMITPEDAARAVLNGIVCDLGRDEVRVLTRFASSHDLPAPVIDRRHRRRGGVLRRGVQRRAPPPRLHPRPSEG